MSNKFNKVKNFLFDVLKIDIGGIVSRIGDLGKKVGNTLQAIAKGVVAMITAMDYGGENPVEAFAEFITRSWASQQKWHNVVVKKFCRRRRNRKSSTTMEAAKAM